jgi:beta-glucosidase
MIKAKMTGAALSGLAMVLAGCAGQQATLQSAGSQPPAGRPLVLAPQTPVTPADWPQLTYPYRTDAATEARIAALIARMSIEEKVGQIVQGDIASVTPEDVRRYHLGSVLNGGNSAPGNDEFAAPERWLALADAYYDASVDTTGGRTAIPVIWGIDAVHGNSNIVGATIFPHNIGLGAARNPELIERIGRATALEIRATGQEWTFAPTVTVPQDPRWGRFYEGYSSDPAIVASYTEHLLRGLQGPPTQGNMLAGPYVIASTKHFLADGGTFEGRDQGDARISERELREVHGAPYVPAIEQGVATVMVSFSSWNGVKMTGNRALLTDILRERMDFEGIVVSDWNAHGQIEGCTNASCPQAVNAGLDMYMAPDTWRDLYHSLVAQVRDGTVPMARLDDAVARILRVKFRLGLFDAGRPSSRPYSGRWELLGAPEHRAIAREAVRQSLVLLRNDGVLPIRGNANVLVAGAAANDIGRQSGGWTLTWQGTGVDNSRFPGATSIADGLIEAVRGQGGQATYAADGQFTQRPDVAVVVFGETPYAEFQGDLPDLRLREELMADLAIMRRLKAQGIPVVAVLLSGRPLFVNAVLNAADAFVAAWLPGSEGAGVADVLIGDVAGRARHDFTGRLPTRWPSTARVGSADLFALGYGLSYRSPRTPWRTLSEEAGVAAAASTVRWFMNGQAPSPWSLQVRDGTDSQRLTTGVLRAFDGRLLVEPVDHLAQEDARRFTLSGGQGTIEIYSFEPVDLSRETNADLMIGFTLRRDGPVGNASLGIACDGADCASFIPIPLASAPQGQWVSYGMSMKCFARRGADMSRVTMPFRLRLNGPARVSISRIEGVANVERVLSCD